jgi:hypothetical protein
MKCLICTSEIDEKKEFIVAGPQGQPLDDIVGRLRHMAELGKWTHLTLTCQRAFTEVILSGHVCPAHQIFPGSIGLVDVIRSAPALAPPAEPPIVPSPSPVPKAPAAPVESSPPPPSLAAPAKSPIGLKIRS